MIRKLSHYIGEYKGITVLTPVLMVLEVVFEVFIPYLMGHIIDDGIKAGDMGYVVRTGLLMMLMALLSLLFGASGAILACKASAGFEKNLRRCQCSPPSIRHHQLVQSCLLYIRF